MLDYQAQVENDNAMKVAAIIREAKAQAAGRYHGGLRGCGRQVGEGARPNRPGHRAVGRAGRIPGAAGRRPARVWPAGRGRGALAQGKAAQAAELRQRATTLMSGSYAGLRSNGWRTKGPRFSGQQMPAPVERRTPVPTGSGREGLVMGQIPGRRLWSARGAARCRRRRCGSPRRW